MNQDDISQKQEQNQAVPVQVGQQFIELVEALQKVPIDTPDAELNATTITDNNGRRIKLN